MTAASQPASGSPLSTSKAARLDDYGLAPWLATVAGRHLLDLPAAHARGADVSKLRDAGDASVVPRARRDELRLAVSGTRPPLFVAQLAGKVGGEFVPMRSAGIKATAVVDDTVDAYAHTGAQLEWDSAASVPVARAASLHASRIDGLPLVYNQADATLPDLLICRLEVADVLLSVMAMLTAEEDAA